MHYNQDGGGAVDYGVGYRIALRIEFCALVLRSVRWTYSY